MCQRACALFLLMLATLFAVSVSAQTPPTAANNTVTTTEDTDYVFKPADFGYRDADGDSLRDVQYVTLPDAGTLIFNDAGRDREIEISEWITSSAIDSEDILFRPAPDGYGNRYARFTFKVRDRADESASSYTMTINVTAVPDAPMALDSTVTAQEDANYVFKPADFGFSDADGDSLRGVQIVTRPDAGTLKYYNRTVILKQKVLVGNIRRLKFHPEVKDANGKGYTSFTFKVRDRTNRYSTDAATMTIDVEPVNDPPVLEAGWKIISDPDPLPNPLVAGYFESGDFVELQAFYDETRITDVDGVPIDADSFEWFAVAPDRSEALLETGGSGSFSYLELTHAHVGKKIKVKITYTDDDGHENTISSALTGKVVSPPPKFDFDNETRSFDENTAPGTDIGSPVASLETGSEPFTYSLSGADAASFAIDTASGQLKTRSGITYDHEAKSSYMVTVGVKDGSASDSVEVTVTLDDVAEPPPAPAAPGLAAVTGNDSQLLVSWTAPRSTGRPAILHYDVRYRQGTTGRWTNGPQNQTGVSATLTGLSGEMLYQAQVRAANDEGDGQWSASAQGTTGAALAPAAPSGLRAAANGRSTINLTWTAPVDDGGSLVSGYKVEVSNDGNTAWSTLEANYPGTTYAHSGLMRGATRHYRVSAVNRIGAGAASAVVQATTIVNRAPVVVDNTVTTLEDTAYTFKESDFQFTDADSDPLASVTVVVLPAKGTLELGNAAVTRDQVVVAAKIHTLTFTPGQNGNSGFDSDYASFTFKVNDGTANSAAAATLTIGVTPVNDPPVGRPSITGTARVGMDLTASESISDADGRSYVLVGTELSRPISFQWVRVEPDGSEGEISGATSATYRLALADQGKTIKVKASYTDQGFTFETVTSAATGTVGPRNRPPAFSAETAAREFQDNVDTDFAIGAAFTATDPDNDPLTYSLSGADAASFAIDAATGQLKTRTGVTYDYDTKDSYTVTVGVMDNFSASDSITVIISVLDADEAPLAPTALSVRAVTGTGSKLLLSWTAPDNTGRPAIGRYEVQYRQGTTGAWENGPQNQTGTSATLTGLIGATSYQVRVRATNYEGDGPWVNVQGTTGAATVPSVVSDYIVRSTGLGIIKIGWTGSKDDGGSPIINYRIEVSNDGTTGWTDLPFSLVGIDPHINSFIYTHIVPPGATRHYRVSTVNKVGTSVASQVVSVAANSNNTPPIIVPESTSVTTDEDKAYTFSASDFPFTDADSDTLASVKVVKLPTDGTLSLNSEVIGSGSLPKTVTKANLDANKLVYSPPANANGAGYASFTFKVNDGTDDSAAVATMIINVSAVNDAPVFATSTATRSFDENTPSGVTIGAAFTATDVDGDTLLYSMASESFFLFNRQLWTLPITYDYEAKSSYNILVEAWDDSRARGYIVVSVTLNDVDEPPLAPASPSLSAVTGAGSNLLVSWVAPANTGRPAILHYDVQYRRGATGEWTNGPQAQTTSATLTGLVGETLYADGPGWGDALSGAGAGDQRRRRRAMVGERPGHDGGGHRADGAGQPGGGVERALRHCPLLACAGWRRRRVHQRLQGRGLQQRQQRLEHAGGEALRHELHAHWSCARRDPPLPGIGGPRERRGRRFGGRQRHHRPQPHADGGGQDGDDLRGHGLHIQDSRLQLCRRGQQRQAEEGQDRDTANGGCAEARRHGGDERPGSHDGRHHPEPPEVQSGSERQRRELCELHLQGERRSR